MNRFKGMMNIMQGKNKTVLFELYQIKHFSKGAAEYHVAEMEDPIFAYRDLRFWFAGTGRRNSEKLLLFMEIPQSVLWEEPLADALPAEHWLLEQLSPVINLLAKDYANNDKNVREKAQFAAQIPNETLLKRNGLVFLRESGCFILRLNFNVPLLNAISVNAKAAARAVRDILDHIKNTFETLSKEQLKHYLDTYAKQQEIRAFLNRNNLCAFVADGSILPRANTSGAPLQTAVPFLSPENLRTTIFFADGTSIRGMGIKRGVTVITGGGYSGKSTLIDAIEMGIYDHVPGDGREFCITDNTALKIYAEDGRPVHNLDLSPFFQYLPNADCKSFSTLHASGSVSQAANIIEAVCGGCALLLIDEDKSATNFMIRDANMRKVIKREPIIPFTDRVRELYTQQNVSSILVIGGSGEYLSHADTVLLMEDYHASDITAFITTLALPIPTAQPHPAQWMQRRNFLPKQTNQPFIYFQTVSSENAKKVIIDENNADITLLSAIVSEPQLNALVFVMEKLLSFQSEEPQSLIDLAQELVKTLHTSEISNTIMPFNFKNERWFEAVRPIDVFCCANRMHGLRFSQK